MLSKEICKKCYVLAGWPWRGENSVEEQLWTERKVVWCPQYYDTSKYGSGNKLKGSYISGRSASIFGPPPSYCFFLLEQLLAAQEICNG